MHRLECGLIKYVPCVQPPAQIFIYIHTCSYIYESYLYIYIETLFLLIGSSRNGFIPKERLFNIPTD